MDGGGTGETMVDTRIAPMNDVISKADIKEKAKVIENRHRYWLLYRHRHRFGTTKHSKHIKAGVRPAGKLSVAALFSRLDIEVAEGDGL